MEPRKQARVLCVDDEPSVLAGLSLHLRRRHDVHTATSGAAALEILARDATFAVVVSDMRMPGMDGAAFLARARQVLPDAVRILLTGQTDLDSALAAVNEGQIFRFLTKPCPPPTFLAAVEAAAEQHRLITAERVLLEQTLHGSIRALTDVLALTSPVAFGRATRIKRHVSDLCARLDMRERWQVEVAAMLSQLGSIVLPADTVEKLYYGQELSAAEHKMVSRVPAVTEQLLGSIPRLEAVRAILALCSAPPRGGELRAASAEVQLAERGAAILRIATDYDALEAQGKTVPLALDQLVAAAERYDPQVLQAFLAICAGVGGRTEVHELSVSALRVGMVLAEDVKLCSGTLLVTRGYEVTPGFLERVRNFRPGVVREPVRVLVSAAARGAA